MPALPSPEAELYHGGQGGHFVKAFGGATPIVVAVAEWQAGKRARLADSTTSASGGERRQKVLGAGDELVDVTLIFGESGWHYPSFTMIVESLDVVCNQTDLIRVTISGYCQGELGDPVAPI
jgi:hypothetical protein